MRAVLVLLLTAGCRQLLGFEEPRATDGDAGEDGRGTDGPVIPGCAGLPQGLLPATCFEPDTSLELAGNTQINTDTDPLCSSGNSMQCFIVATAITVSGNIAVVGSRPLVLWAATTIVVTGTLDVSSRAGKIGPAANPVTCPTTLDGTFISAGGDSAGTGGVGGAYAVRGGAAGGARLAAGAIGGQDNGTALSAALHGGCHGGDGGLSQGSRGHGGGAVYLMSGTRIRIASVITASGEGGRGGTLLFGNDFGGGGGGGGGGLIGLDAPVVELDGGTLVALGGGGGSGAADGNLGLIPGVDGDDPAIQPPLVGQGGQARTLDNEGGRGGGAEGSAGMPGGDVLGGNVGGGGGGGGGSGFILTFGNVVENGTIVAPPAM